MLYSLQDVNALYYSILQHSQILWITSFCIIFDICYMMNLPFYIYSRILPVLISACRIEFNLYKMWIYSIIVFYNTLKHNRIILYNIWYLQHDETTVLYIFQNTPSVDEFSTRRECTVLQFNNRIILYKIWYLQHDATTVLYIFQNTSVDFKMLYYKYYKTWVNALLQYSQA